MSADYEVKESVLTPRSDTASPHGDETEDAQQEMVMRLVHGGKRPLWQRYRAVALFSTGFPACCVGCTV